MSNTESTLSLVFLVFVYLGAQWPRNQMGRLSPSHKEDIGAAAGWAWCQTTLCILCSLRHSQGLRLHPSHVQHPLTCGRNKAEMKQSTFDTLLHNSSKYQQKSQNGPSQKKLQFSSKTDSLDVRKHVCLVRNPTKCHINVTFRQREWKYVAQKRSFSLIVYRVGIVLAVKITAMGFISLSLIVQPFDTLLQHKNVLKISAG